MNETRMGIRDKRISSSSCTSSAKNNEEPADVSAFTATSDELIQKDDSFLPQLIPASPQYESAVWPNKDMTLRDSTESGTSLHAVCFEDDPSVSKHHTTVRGSYSNRDDERMKELTTEMTRSASDGIAYPSADDSHEIPLINTHYNGTDHVLDVELEQESERICQHACPEPEASYTKPEETIAHYAENCEPVNVLCISSAACNEATVRSKAYDKSLSVKVILAPHACQDEHQPDQTEDVVLIYDPEQHLCTVQPVAESLLSANNEFHHEAQSVAVEGLRPSKPTSHRQCLKHKSKQSSRSSSKHSKRHRTDTEVFYKKVRKAGKKKDGPILKPHESLSANIARVTTDSSHIPESTDSRENCDDCFVEELSQASVNHFGHEQETGTGVESLLCTNNELHHEAHSVAVEGPRPSKPHSHLHCHKHKHKWSSCSSSKHSKRHRTDNDTFGKNVMKAEEKKDNAGTLSRCAHSGDDPAIVPNAPSKSEARIGEDSKDDQELRPTTPFLASKLHVRAKVGTDHTQETSIQGPTLDERAPSDSKDKCLVWHTGMNAPRCYPAATDSRSDLGSVASSSTTTNDDFLFKRPPTPPKRPKKRLPRYAIDDPEEIKDNESPGWEPFRRLTTDEERFQAVRKVWHNSGVPDPQVDMSVFNYGRIHVDLKPSNLGSDRQSHERAGSSSSSSKYSERLRADMEIYDRKIRNAVKERNRALSKAYEDLNRNMRHLYRTKRKEEKSESLGSHNSSLGRNEHRRSYTPPRDSHYWRMQERKIRDDFRAKEEEIMNTHSAKLITLRRAKEEVSRVNAFYAGLLDSDPQMLSGTHVNEQKMLEKTIKRMEKLYNESD